DGEERLSQLGAMEKGAGFNLAASHVEAPNRAPPQDVRKIAAAQQQARTVFSAKQPARSRTLLLTGSAAAVVLGLVGFGTYYWQITSTGSMALPASTPQPASAAAPAISVDAGAPQQQGTPAASAQNPIDKPAPVTVQASPPVSTASDPARAEARSEAEPFKENPAIRIRQSAATSQLNPTLGKAYQSFRSGDTGTAQQLYHKILQQEPNNRDALLGMAAIALKHKQAGQAAAYYGKLLELDPADPEALAALIGLQGQTDPTQSESRLKKALAQNPQADVIYFALGNLYAQQSRWAEAQQSYFRAYSSTPGNADYAFNLAVSLDHLNQGKLALDYYQRALAQPGPANFDKSSVQTRIQELLQPAGS
ncbi:MAG: tetratricopeptide repeat protein, partial [Sulfuricella sp.]